MADPAKTIPYILEARFGAGLMRALLALLMFAYLSCAGAVQAAAARLLYSYARDGMLPFSGWLCRISTEHRVPGNAMLFSAAAALAVCAATFVDLGAVNVNASRRLLRGRRRVPVVPVVVLARLIAAARGWRPDARPGEFSLGAGRCRWRGWPSPMAWPCWSTCAGHARRTRSRAGSRFSLRCSWRESARWS
jgi:hypothetical protein